MHKNNAFKILGNVTLLLGMLQCLLLWLCYFVIRFVTMSIVTVSYIVTGSVTMSTVIVSLWFCLEGSLVKSLKFNSCFPKFCGISVRGGEHPDLDLTSGLGLEIPPIPEFVPESYCRFSRIPECRIPQTPEVPGNKTLLISELKILLIFELVPESDH